MYIKVTRSGTRRYVQLVEAYRDEGGKPRQRTVATLGRLDQLQSELDSVIAGLLKVAGREPVLPPPPQVTFDSARAFGDTWALLELWQSLGFSQLKRLFGRTRHAIDIEALTRVMVLNRLCDPESKLGVLRWLETVSLPGIDTAQITHQHLLRTMDALVEQREAVENCLASLLRPLIDQELSVVFYDLTTISVCGETEYAQDVRAFGRSKSGTIERQFALGLVQTADGLPIAHEVLEGNIHEGSTLLPMIRRLTQRYPIRRVVLVADRGLLTLDNLTELEALQLPSGQPLEYVLAVPAARYRDFGNAVAGLGSGEATWIAETHWEDRRLVVAHDDAVAASRRQSRRERIQELERQAEAWFGKLEAQEGGRRYRGRKLSDSGAKARFYHAVQEASLGHIIQVDLQAEGFNYSLRQEVLDRLEALDGKLLLVTNVADLGAEEIVDRYKALADIERGFRVLKSEIEIGPVYHRLPDRIRAHALICFVALILYRVMRSRLKAAGSVLSPERALELLRRIQHHQVRLNENAPVSGLSTITTDQAEVYSALKVKKPSSSQQLPLL